MTFSSKTAPRYSMKSLVDLRLARFTVRLDAKCRVRVEPASRVTPEVARSIRGNLAALKAALTIEAAHRVAEHLPSIGDEPVSGHLPPLDVGWIPSFTNWHPTYETDPLPGLPAVALAVSGQNGGWGGGNAVTNRAERETGTDGAARGERTR